MDKATADHLNDIRGNQANRLNDGWAGPGTTDLTRALHSAYQDIEFLLALCDPAYPARYSEDEA